MKIIVDKMPEQPNQCLFSIWKDYGWCCTLYDSKHYLESIVGIGTYICDPKNCPYLRKE